MRVRNATSGGSRLASSRCTNWSRNAPPRAAIDDTSACGSLPAAITDSASCKPSGQPSASSCRRAAASRSTRVPNRARTSSIVSSSRKRSCAGPDHGATAVSHQVVDVDAVVGARRHHGAQVGRRVAQQIGQRLVSGCAAGDRPRRRSARCPVPFAPPRPARRSRLPGRWVRPTRAACGRRSGGQRRRAPPAPGFARSAARRLAAAPTATPPRCRVPGVRGATARAATSCRSRRLPAPGSTDSRAVARDRIAGAAAPLGGAAHAAA